MENGYMNISNSNSLNEENNANNSIKSNSNKNIELNQ